MKIEEAIQAAYQGNSVLFIGAGHSLGAKNLRDIAPRTGRKLSEFIALRSGLPIESPLEDAAEAFIRTNGVDELIRELKREYTIKDVDRAHLRISRIPWSRIYTTNYDNLMELSAQQNGISLSAVTPDDKIQDVVTTAGICVHLNGYIDRLDRSTIHSSFRLTDTSYTTTSLETSPWITMMRQDLHFARSVFFIGYSLYDLDIRRILFSTLELNAKCFFILDEACDPVTEMRAAKYGQVHKIGRRAFADLCLQVHDAGIQSAPKDKWGKSIIEQSTPAPSSIISDKDTLGLLLYGHVNPSCISHSMNSAAVYYDKRPQVQQIMTAFSSGSRIIVLHSDIANGKSMICEGVAISAMAQGWRVLRSSMVNQWSEIELRHVFQSTTKTLLIVEDYPEWLSFFANTTLAITDSVHVLLTARTAIHDVLDDSLSAAFHQQTILEVSANLLSTDEIAWWQNALATYGLWGERAGLSPEQKQRFIRDTCKSQIHALLLKILGSPHVSKRFEDVASAIKEDKSLEPIMVCIFALTLLDSTPSFETLIELLGATQVSNAFLQRNASVSQFVDLTRSSVIMRSPIAAEYMLNQFWAAEEVVTVLVQLAKRAEECSKISRYYDHLFKQLMQYSSLQILLPQKGRKTSVVNYYEQLKTLRRCATNPLFWLQYAIGVLVNDDLPRAEKYFATAYSLAEKNNWDTYQIDNHFARFLLIKAAEDAPFKEALVYFRKARTIINRQIRDEKLHYPYRVAKAYQPFVDRFASEFTHEQAKEILEASKTIMERIDSLPSDRISHRDVRSCRDAMEYVISRMLDVIK